MAARFPFQSFSLSLLSSLLLTLCFPRFNFGFLAWFALIPFLTALYQARTCVESILLGLTLGLAFFSISLHWLTNVSTFGWVFVTFLETIFVMIFSWWVYESKRFTGSIMKITWIGLAWTVTEWMRAEVPVFGLGWNLLAYSQADYGVILQFANVLGAYGLGFMIVVVNVCFFLILIHWQQQGKDGRLKLLLEGLIPSKYIRGLWVSLSTLGFVWILILSHGIYHWNRKPFENPMIKISVLQGNIPQDIKWAPEAREKIIEIYSRLTQIAGYEKPDLIVWPEAAFPGYFNRDPLAESVSDLVDSLRIPLLLGSPHLDDLDTAFNSAYLLNPYGEIAARYDKQYLVPFGEYVPMKFIFGWLEPLAYSLGVSDFHSGKESKVFRWADINFPFSVLICFEDVFPGLAREMVDRGAKFLAVITNDAWFGNSAAPYQHLAASIFRAVENGVPVIRAANTGVSAFISPKGRVTSRVRDKQGRDTFVMGSKTDSIALSHEITLYRAAGYLFPYFAALVFATLFIAEKFDQRKRHEVV